MTAAEAATAPETRPTPTEEVAKEGREQLEQDLVGAVGTANDAAGVLGDLAGVKTGSDLLGAVATGLEEAMEAVERGVSNEAANIDGAAAALIGAVPGNRVDTVAGVVNGIAQAIAPDSVTAAVTETIAGATGSETATGLTTGTVDTIDAIVAGDTEQLVAHADQNLAGDYGQTVEN